jgi:hypothetical protein
LYNVRIVELILRVIVQYNVVCPHLLDHIMKRAIIKSNQILLQMVMRMISCL